MIVAIIQARLGSTRLPGKVAKKILGKSLLEHLIMRVKRAKSIDSIIVATTTNKEDARVVTLAKKAGVKTFRGSENDVLDRYYQAARFAKTDVIVRITGDCPLMDPAIIDRVVNFYKKNKKWYDYASNVRPPTYPDGMDVEVFSFDALEKSWHEARLLSEREHVTPYIAKNKKQFRIGNARYKKDYSKIRLTVDTPEDLMVIRHVLTRLYSKNQRFTLEDVLRLQKKEPELFDHNAHIARNDGYKKSLREDRMIKTKK